MAPFVALKPAAPITIASPPFRVADRLDCTTTRWGGATTFTGQLRPSTAIPLIVDMFIVASEMDLMEVRLYELSESVDWILVGISPHTHRGDPQPNWYQHAKDHHHRFTKGMLEKILIVDVGKCAEHQQAKKNQVHAELSNLARKHPKRQHNHGDVFAHQLTQRDCLWKHGVKQLKQRLVREHNSKKENVHTQVGMSSYTLPDNTVFLFTDVDEIPDRELVHHVKMCTLKKHALPAHLRMRINGHNFRVPCSDGTYRFTGASEMAEWRTVREDGGVVYRFRPPPGIKIKRRRKHTIHDAGVHLTWYGSMAFVDYKG